MEPDEKHIPKHLRWVAPEHISVARNMGRTNGVLVITLNPIFAYSQSGQKPWMLGKTRPSKRR